jgi:hypothetical protein
MAVAIARNNKARKTFTKFYCFLLHDAFDGLRPAARH